MTLLLVAVALMVGFAIGFGVRTGRRPRYRVEVGPSYDGRREVQHMVSARIVTGHRKRKRVPHFERVDMREDGWEDRLTVAVAHMKQKRAALLAAERIAGER